MELIRGIHNLRLNHCGCVLSIGNFDGVHLGHRAVLQRLVCKAKELNLPSCVLLFEPHPQEFFAAQSAPARLSSLRDKIQLLAEVGIDRIVCVGFDRSFAKLTAEQFVEQLLVTKLGAEYLVVGDDFRFGFNRAGDFQALIQAAKKHGFQVENTATFSMNAQRVSSTKIRMALAQNQLQQASKMLGRMYAISGRVIHGNALGRTIGFPTANVALKRQILPVRGAYCVRVELANGKRYAGMANIGSRPTVQGIKDRLEVHLFDFAGDLYGKPIYVELLAKLRDEQFFASVEELTTQLHQDKLKAQELFMQLGQFEFKDYLDKTLGLNFS